MLKDTEELISLNIPATILKPINGALQSVTIRPLSVHSFQLIAKAAKEDASLIPLLIVKESVVEPILGIQEIKSMKVGLVNFLIKEIKNLSGI